MRTSLKVHHPQAATTTLPAHEQAARRRRARTERPVSARASSPKPAPAQHGRKTVDTRFPPTV